MEVEQDILNSFRKNGFELISPRFNHMRNFLTCLPFMAGKGLFKQLKEAGVVQRAESFNVANLMPLVADTVTYFQRDRYGRILGQVYAPDGMNINQFMVRAGAAWVYEQYNTDPVLPVLQNEARQQKRGLWSDADPVPPWIWRHPK
ncbi:thermonuclease family protein [Escherichia coli]|uniref:thermonuclease family protein n=1 Tax=Escherichia coli TaxID=562 RepID=UPI0032B48FD6